MGNKRCPAAKKKAETNKAKKVKAKIAKKSKILSPSEKQKQAEKDKRKLENDIRKQFQETTIKCAFRKLCKNEDIYEKIETNVLIISRMILDFDTFSFIQRFCE